MHAHAYAWRVPATAAVTSGVWARPFATRIAEMGRERIHPQSVVLSAQAPATFRGTRAADTRRNRFELPVLCCVGMMAWRLLPG